MHSRFSSNPSSGTVLRLAFLLSLFVVVAPCFSAQNGNQRMDEERLSAMQKEWQRQNRVKMWAIRKKASPVQLFEQLYKPVALANRKQQDENLERANRFNRRYQKAKEDREEKNARKYGTLAKLYLSYAEKNKAVVEAYKDHNSGEMQDAFDAIYQIERRIQAATGRMPEREWFLPRELEQVTMARTGS